jgi:hypothetical protein
MQSACGEGLPRTGKRSHRELAAALEQSTPLIQFAPAEVAAHWTSLALPWRKLNGHGPDGKLAHSFRHFFCNVHVSLRD